MSAKRTRHSRSGARHRSDAGAPSGRACLGRAPVLAGIVFFALFAAYMANGDILPGKDAVTNARLSVKLLAHGTLAFTPEQDPFMFSWLVSTRGGERRFHFRSWDMTLEGVHLRRLFERGVIRAPEPDYYLVETRRPGVYVSKYGPAAGLFAWPFFAAVSPFVGGSIGDRPALVWNVSKVAAAAAVAGSAVLLFLTALPFARRRTALGLALAFGLGTCVWSTSSQALWQHGPAGLFLALGVFGVMRPQRPWAPLLAGLALSAAFACRPTAALVVAAVGVHYLLVSRGALLRFALAGLPVAILLAAHNWHHFGKILVLGQLATREAHAVAPIVPGSAGLALGLAAAGLELVAGQAPGLGSNLGLDAETLALVAGPLGASVRKLFSGSLPAGLAGSLVSPSRGLLVFSPIAIFAFWGAVRAWREPRFAGLRPIGAAAVGLFLVAAAWGGWWGGWSYGYRLLLETVTLLAFLAIPVAERIRAHRRLAAVFLVLLAWSIAVQVLGAFAYDVVGWNNRPGYKVEAVDGKTTFLLDRDEADRLAKERGTVVTPVNLNVDGPLGKARLWSLRDSQIVYYFQNFRQARRLKREAISQFLAKSG